MTDKNYDPHYASDESSTSASLRDKFAMAAMQGDWATERMDSGYWSQNDIDAIFKDKAETYYRMADAMLKARG